MPKCRMYLVQYCIYSYNRRKSALPKYEPPYMKRPRMLAKGYSHPNSPHPSQHVTPDHTFDDGSKLSLGGFNAAGPYR